MFRKRRDRDKEYLADLMEPNRTYGGVIGPGRSKIPMPGFVKQLSRPEGFFGPLQVGLYFRLEKRQVHSCIPSRRAWR